MKLVCSKGSCPEPKVGGKRSRLCHLRDETHSGVWLSRTSPSGAFGSPATLTRCGTAQNATSGCTTTSTPGSFASILRASTAGFMTFCSHTCASSWSPPPLTPLIPLFHPFQPLQSNPRPGLLLFNDRSQLILPCTNEQRNLQLIAPLPQMAI
ncbi:hypothetical protein VTI28DRAFT_5088 [Corynascus sepedonium]